MSATESRRVATVLKQRMTELGLNAQQLAEKAGLNPTTVRRLLHGQTTASPHTREALNAVLEWPTGYGTKRVQQLAVLAEVPTDDLVEELRRRCGGE